jgi:ABC-type branched-subunit amino acid transport system substrate-binding protein
MLGIGAKCRKEGQFPSMKRSPWGACVLLKLLVGFLFGGAWAPTEAHAADIVLGMSAAFRGPSAGLGIEHYRGAMAYFEHVNRSGGVHGRTIVLKAYDDGYEPGPAIRNTIRLVEQDHALLLYGYVGTPTVTRVLPLLKKYQDQSILLFFPFTGAEPQRRLPYRDYVFNLRASYTQEAAGLVDHFTAIGRRRIAIFYQIDAYGRSGAEGARMALARHGLRIVGEATYRRGASFAEDMRPQVDHLRRADPDVILFIGSYAACAAFVRDARDANLNVPIANVSFVGSESLLTLLQAHGQARGRDYTRDLINSQVVPCPYDDRLPAVRDYRELLERYQPMPPADLASPDYRPLPPTFVGLEGFLSAKALVAVLERVGPELDRAKIRQAAESVGRIQLGIDVLAVFRPDHHQGLDQVYYTTVVDGHFVNLTDWSRWRR